MKLSIEKLAGLASRVRTPLALSGVVTVVLYAIYKQVLSLGVFANIGATPTFQLLQDVLDKLFWLALVAIVLGVASYLVTVVLSHRMSSHSSELELIDASLDLSDSPYEETTKGETKIIRPKRQTERTGHDNDQD